MKTRTLDEKQFDNFLEWLDPDRDNAAKKYIEIRDGLIRFFIFKKANDCEDLADEVIMRVASRVGSLTKNYPENILAYFYTSARHILIEYSRKKSYEVPIESNDLPTESYFESEASPFRAELANCLKEITSEDKELILAYYSESKAEKIRTRRKLAEELNLSTSALHVRVHRIKSKLMKCIREHSKKENI